MITIIPLATKLAKNPSTILGLYHFLRPQQVHTFLSHHLLRVIKPR
jgi:hypothetical protein